VISGVFGIFWMVEKLNIMTKSAILFVALGLLFAGANAQHTNRNKKQSQPPAKPAAPATKKYPSLLWEITGNGLKQPSYLFGTMHVSDKLAFHLGDSFYNAIKSVNVVALETNPENWQEDFSHSVFYRNANRRSEFPGNGSRGEVPYDFMQITTFAIDTYEEKVKAALAVEPSMINGMLYRNYDEQQGDFEEDTFLDMYIFQVGKKLGKRVCGVEDFKESEKLVMEAYRDMIKDQNKKRRSYDYESMMTNPKKVEDAYRKGDLDLLDSLEAITVFSEAFQEKFLYKRNEIQANSIDTIMKKQALFVGVGAAHLPGSRGVIEMLREKGYTLRPVQMDDRNSVQKETIEKMRPEKSFTMQSSDDGFFKVSIPGDKFYRFTDWQGMDVVQYADMVNGAYYMVTRIKTNSLFWGHSSDQVYKKIDSLLYENVPGKILKRSVINKNGYKGFDFTNRTRRGDNQRYQVFVTPFEIIVFKISGTGEFISVGNTAQNFFGSVTLKEYPAASWKNWQPDRGGFSVDLPHTPSLLHDNSFGTDRLEYSARDEQDGNSYLVMQANLHNYTFLEEDTFELRMMDESYGYSSFIDRQVSSAFTKVNGRSALESKYKHKDGSYSSVKYIIRGPVYYAAIARYKNDNANVQKFLQSFSIIPFNYAPAKKHRDSVLRMTVTSPVYPAAKPNDDMMAEAEDLFRQAYQDDDPDDAKFESRLIGNDTTGEKILVSYTRLSKYAFLKDSSKIWESRYGGNWTADSSLVISVNRERRQPNGFLVRDLVLSDTGCSRVLLVKSFYKNGNFFHISAISDTIGKKSAFIDQFFSSYTPDDTLKGASLFTRKSDQLFNDLFSKDSAVAKTAAESIYGFKFDSTDVPNIKKTISQLHWGMRNYLSRKQRFITVLGTLNDSTVTPYLKDLYWKVKDTVALQNAILQSLLAQKTKSSFITFRDLIIQEPPIVDEEIYDYREARLPRVIGAGRSGNNVYISSPWNDLYDTLKLTKSIFPEFLQLMHVDDYRDEVLDLLVIMVDSGYLKAKDYESYFSKIYVDGRQLLKKQMAREDKEKMDKAAMKDRRSSQYYASFGEEEKELDAGNEELDKYVVLLLPYRDKNPGVQSFFEQLMQTRDRRLQYNTFIHLLQHNQKVPDSLFTQFATADKYRSELYKDLEKMKKLDKFPVAYKNQLSIARSMLLSSSNRYDRMDTVAYIDKLPVKYEDRKGFVYFFKYKRMRDDAAWQVASVGMQPEKLGEIDVDNDDFIVREERKLESDRPVKEQLEQMLKEMVYSKRNSASMFYEGRSFALYKNYLSEMVKNQRYRD
jgi:uncharacterized protein YbaP (TraB family)